MRTVSSEERDSGTLGASTTGTANTMNIVFRVVWIIIVDHMSNVAHIFLSRKVSSRKRVAIKQVPAADKGAISILFRALSFENEAVGLSVASTLPIWNLIPIVWSGSSEFRNLKRQLDKIKKCSTSPTCTTGDQVQGETSTRPVGSYHRSRSSRGGGRTTRHD